uniref:RRM domain-containing protein n=1 Tax=Lactuca sativa TaxID=4236 RepID=A0A9R1VMR1_LACSA|nr:hypothetical protein LSAT_V11C500282250 [Lactuca sativa]
MGRSSRTLYVGNLPGDIREREIEDLFYKYGPIVEIDLKIPPRPPVFAFVEFEDPRDAEDAIRGRDGYKFDGQRLRVELAHGGRSSSSIDRHRSGGGSHGGVSRRTDYRVYVTGLPSSASWQDLKDHMRRAGDVCFSQVFRDRDGKWRSMIEDTTSLGAEPQVHIIQEAEVQLTATALTAEADVDSTAFLWILDGILGANLIRKR